MIEEEEFVKQLADDLDKSVELEKSEKTSLKKKTISMKYNFTDERVEDSDHFCYVKRLTSMQDEWETRSFRSQRIFDFFEKIKYQ